MTNPMDGRGKVVVALSGGVDSSVAAALLVEQGYTVIGMMLKLWSEAGKEDQNRCCTPDSMAVARRVAAVLDIPFYAVDARDAFYETVVQSFIDGYERGQTPNPCLECNRLIKWDYLLARAHAIGADYLATGHYARLERRLDEKTHLMKAVDSRKDQSYVLSVLDQAQLGRTLLPLGEMTKPEVREKARSLGLAVADQPDSQDLCFLGDGDYRDFLTRHAEQANTAGDIVDTDGNVIGKHNGLADYTIGQRKGLRIASETPLYVIEKEAETQKLVVGPFSALGKKRLVADRANWISGNIPPQAFSGEIKIRYKAKAAPGIVTPLEEGRSFKVDFEEELRDITPGQAAVIYNKEEVIGSGIIQK